MVIYVFLLGFSSPSNQKEWFMIWKIKDQPNHTNHIKEPQSSHYLVVHEDAHLSYKWYKVEKFYFKGHSRYTSTSIHKYTLFLYFSKFSLFFGKNKKQNKKKKKNLKTKHKNKYTNKASKTKLTQNTTTNHAWDQESEGITWNLFLSKWVTWMENLSFAWTLCSNG